jgi:hypothetical protein
MKQHVHYTADGNSWMCLLKKMKTTVCLGIIVWFTHPIGVAMSFK